jgi:outer membrane lipoprotein-sorting protein
MNYLKPLLILVLGCFTTNMYAQDALEIVRRADEKVRGKSNYSEMTIQIVRPTWQRDMKMRGWSLGDTYSLIIIDTPKRDKGTVFLKRDKEIWNWLPGIDKSIKLPPSMMLQNWMGTDFTNDDLVKQSSIVTDYTHVLDGDSIIEGMSCYKVVLTPKDDAAVVWGKLVLFIEKEEYLQMRVEFYDEDGYLINLMNGYNPQMMGGRMILKKMEMIPVETPDKKTVMIYDKLQFDIDVDESYFTTQNMKRVR